MVEGDECIVPLLDEHTLTPLIVAMAGNDIFDPFKD
jgi:hypothetical protein